MVRSILDGIARGAVHWAEVHDPAVVEGDCNLECSFRLAEGTDDRFEGTSGRTCLLQRLMLQN